MSFPSVWRGLTEKTMEIFRLDKMLQDMPKFVQNENGPTQMIMIGKSIFHKWVNKISSIMRKPTICMCENKDADQLRGNCKADQHLYFHYKDITIPLLSK